MTKPVLCFRVSYDGHLIEVPGKGKTMDEVSTHLPQGVYTTLRTYSRRTLVVGLVQHIERLVHSARRSGYLGTVDEAQIRQGLRLAVKQLPGADEARMRITIDLTIEPGAVFITLQHLPPIPLAIFEQGVRVQSSSVTRQSPDIKSTSFLVDTQSERQSLPANVYELIMVDERGRILEGMTSNFFAVRSGTIYTARENVLSGVTRQIILDLAHSAGLPILLEPFSIAAVDQLDEAFITSSSRGVVPVVCIDDCIIGSGQPGSITQKLSTAYKRFILQSAEEI